MSKAASGGSAKVAGTAGAVGKGPSGVFHRAGANRGSEGTFTPAGPLKGSAAGNYKSVAVPAVEGQTGDSRLTRIALNKTFGHK